jgi:hypothetical protein
MAILAVRSWRAQSVPSSVPRNAGESRAFLPVGTAEFPIFCRLFADLRIRGPRLILRTFHVVSGPAGDWRSHFPRPPRPPMKLRLQRAVSLPIETSGDWNAGCGYRNGNCRQCRGLDPVEALPGDGLRARIAAGRTQPHRHRRLRWNAARRRYRVHRLQRAELSRPHGAVCRSQRRDRGKLHELCGHGGCRAIRVERRRKRLARNGARLVRAAAKPAVAVILADAPRHPDLQRQKRRRPCGRPAGRDHGRRVFRHSRGGC